LSRRFLRWLLIESAAFHFTEYAFALHFLFQNSKSLIDIVISDEHLQMFTPARFKLRRRARDDRTQWTSWQLRSSGRFQLAFLSRHQVGMYTTVILS
jgi:hypothetical protein